MAKFRKNVRYYMSPEQSRNAKDAVGRCDIYSIGATLYHLLVGQIPFEVESSIDVILKHCNEDHYFILIKFFNIGLILQYILKNFRNKLNFILLNLVDKFYY